MRRTIHTTVALGIAAGVALTVVGVILTPQILRWMGTPDSVLANSIAYFRMYFFGSIAVVMLQRGCKHPAISRRQQKPDAVSDCRVHHQCHSRLDFGRLAAHVGVGAAAFATIVSQTVSAILAFAKADSQQRGMGRALERGQI